MINFYRIVSSNTDKVYVGSTVKPIEERLNSHERDYRKYQDGKFRYITSIEILEFKDYRIELIETKLCETKADRDTIERYHILNTPTAVNKTQPGRTRAQHYRDNKENIRQNQDEKHNCNCGGKFTTAHKTEHERTNKHQTFIRNQPVNINGNNNVIHIYN